MIISPSGRRWRPYARAGIIAGKPRIYNQDKETFNNDSITREWEIKGKTAWGLQGGLGLHYALNARVGLFAEGIFRSLSFIPETGKVTSYEKNGENQFNTLSGQQREWEYKEAYTINRGNNQSPASLPAQASNDPLPLGAVGLQLGVQLHLR
jgi:hypothetical protein